jgi:site-specific DNA recombinase
MTTAPTSTVRAAIYARVSSDQQAQEQTIESQVAALRERVATDGLQLDEELCFLDDGVSGSTLMRPALERLRDLAYVGGFQKLYVHSPDRLARRYAYQVLLVDELKKHGVQIEFLNRAIGVSPEEDLLLQMQGMFAEYERAKIMERSRRGKRHAAGRGSINVLSGAPYGYRYVSKRDGGGDAAYELHEEQAAVVQQIFQWVGRDRVSIGEVARRLEAKGIPSATGKSWWDRTSVWGMLKNPAYKGSAAFGKTRTGVRRPQLRTGRGRSKTPRRTGSTYDTEPSEQISIPVPAIVSEELFATVQEQLTENRLRGRERQRGARYLLQGFLECQCCGYAYYGKKVSRSSAKGKVPYAYYRCVGTDAYRFGGTRVCENKQVRTDKLDQAVWNDACELLRNPQLLRKEYERRLAAPDDSDGEQSLRKQIGNAQRTVNRLIDAYADGVVTREEFEPRIERARKRLSDLEAKLDGLQSQTREQAALRKALACLDSFADTIHANLDQADWSTRREILRTLIERVVIEPHQIRIVYRINFPLFAKNASKEKVLHFGWRSDHASLGRSGVRVAYAPVLHHARLEPFANQAQQYPVSYPMLEKLPQVVMIQVVKELADIHFEYPAALEAHRLLPKRLQGLVRRSFGPETIRAVREVVLVDRFQQHDDRPLENLVLQGWDSDRAGLGFRVPFRNVHPPDRRSSIRAGFHAVEQPLEVSLQIGLILGRRHSVYARGCVLPGPPVRFLQPVEVHQVSQ